MKISPLSYKKTASLATLLPCHPVKLPKSVQEIADVLGRERALYLVGKLPRCYVEDRRQRETNKGGLSERVILYVPKVLKPDHQLVAILGWRDAQALVDVFGGELLAPGNCGEVLRSWKNAGILSVCREGVPNALVAQWFGVTERHVRNVLAAAQENPQQAANDNQQQNATHLTAHTEHTAWKTKPELQRQSQK